MSELDKLVADHESVFGESSCPDWVKESLERYVTHGIPTGDCLRAVLCNDLMQAFQRADPNTARSMAAIASYIYNSVPRVAVINGEPREVYGSAELVNAWLTAHAELRRIARSS